MVLFQTDLGYAEKCIETLCNLVVVLYRVGLARNMRQGKFFWVALLILFSCLGGCLSGNRTESSISLVVDANIGNGTIVKSYSDGELISSTNVSIDFDFSKSSGDNMLTTYGIEALHNQSPVTVNASLDSIITVDFENHGIYDVNAYAIDENNLKQMITIKIQIDLRIEWAESDTHEPKTLTFDPNPINGGPSAKIIEINSIVENPSLIEDLGNGAQSVQITWNIIDEQNDICQRKSTQIEDGASENWYTVHFNTFQVHQLEVIYEDGQDNINVNHSIAILYED